MKPKKERLDVVVEALLLCKPLRLLLKHPFHQTNSQNRSPKEQQGTCREAVGGVCFKGVDRLGVALFAVQVDAAAVFSLDIGISSRR